MNAPPSAGRYASSASANSTAATRRGECIQGCCLGDGSTAAGLIIGSEPSGHSGRIRSTPRPSSTATLRRGTTSILLVEERLGFPQRFLGVGVGDPLDRPLVRQ